MSAFNNLLSGLLKDAMDNVASAVKDKIEDVVDDVLHPDEENVTVTVAEEITIQSLCNRLGEGTTPMTGEEFIRRMNSVGYEAELYVMPEEMRKQMKIPEEFLKRQLEKVKNYTIINNDNPLFHIKLDVYKEEAEAVERINAILTNTKNIKDIMADAKKPKGYKEYDVSHEFFMKDDNRLFMHTTIVTDKNVFKTYQLYSRIGNTLLDITIPEENADAYAADIVKALQGTGY